MLKDLRLYIETGLEIITARYDVYDADAIVIDSNKIKYVYADVKDIVSEILNKIQPDNYKIYINDMLITQRQQ